MITIFERKRVPKFEGEISKTLKFSEYDGNLLESKDDLSDFENQTFYTLSFRPYK